MGIADAVAPPRPATRDWDLFDPDWYAEHNYRALRDDDRRILALVADWFAEAVDRPGRGIDVGSGANLYPALAMLPWCERIDLCEPGAANVDWLERERRWLSPLWDPYWDVLAERAAYAAVAKPRDVFAGRVRVLRGDLFALPPRRFDVGSMFFVAESITDQPGEFDAAVVGFVGSLKPGAPFAAAFMAGSTGYTVGGVRYPAVAVDEMDVERCLAPVARDVRVERVVCGEPLRDGYRGMVLAVGRADG